MTSKERTREIRPVVTGRSLFKRFISASVLLFYSVAAAHAGLGLPQDIVTESDQRGAFPVVAGGQAAELWHDEGDHKGVIRAIGDLQADVERVTGRKPQVFTKGTLSKMPIIIGTLGKSALIDSLVSSGKLDDSDLKGKWESFVIAVVNRPTSGVDRALVIAGSDKRGTIYGIYELSEQLGVSPWYWWADVPPKKRAEAYVLPGRYASGEPKVKYRGIFINDEEPAFGPWAREKFGGINSKMYVHMFELILRLRGNYLWPAMWGKAFNEDDPLNPVLADEYGIVMGTSHHEPMIRAQEEWTKRKANIGNGQWNYATNEEGLRNFWTDGIKRNKDYESIVTIGMRGDGDEEMIRGGNMDDNVALLEKIVADQREILKEYMNPDVTQIPQLWALYKEVMNYYEHGMRVPDDVTLLWCDDNWGNIRRLPTPEERKRSGGAGIYYHFDYVGGPRSYRWINTNPLPKIWEQMNLAYEYDANEIWIVNVGDLKPMELPIEFFLRMAWDPEALPKEKIGEFTEKWAARDFGAEHAEEIADIVSKYLKYAGWRKPELIDPNTFSVVDYREAERVSEQWNDLVKRAEKVNAELSEEQRDAFYQLGLYPVKAFATVVDMYIAAAYNRLYVEQGRASANLEAEKTRTLFAQDQSLSDYFHTEISDGKWNHMMSQNRIGYTGWAEPRRQVMPRVQEVVVPDTDAFGVAIDGSRSAWPGGSGVAMLPAFDSINNQRSFIDVFQRGSKAITYTFNASQPWIILRKDKAFNEVDDRLWVEIDWSKAPVGKAEGEVVIGNADQTVAVKVTAHKATAAQQKEADGAFGGLVGPIAIDAGDYSKKQSVNGVRWEAIPDYLRAESGMTIFPTTAESILPPNDAPYIEYPVYIAEPGKVDVDLIFGPVLAFVPGRGVRVAVSFDDQAPQVLNVVMTNDRAWDATVQNNSRRLTSSHEVKTAGKHTIRVTMVDPAVVLQRLIVHQEPLPRTYFGPESVKDKASSMPKSFVSKGNPIFTDAFTADPAPLVVGDELYVYVGHDEAKDGGDYYNITEWLCYSTKDMKTWTSHGSVLKPTDFKWATGEAWASQVVEKDGKYYYYTTAQHGQPHVGKAIGVAVSDHPTGPFVDAIGKALVIDSDTPGRGWNDIDPTVWIDEDGTAWMYWGNGSCFYAKLKPNMIEIDGEIKQVRGLEGFVEGPWLHKRGDLYYLTYAGFKRGSENIRYATAEKIDGPWTNRGELSGNANNSFTIHPGIVEFKDQWYLFYHNATLTLNGLKGITGRRSVCVDYLYYDRDGLMMPVPQTREGVTVPPVK